MILKYCALYMARLLELLVTEELETGKGLY